MNPQAHHRWIQSLKENPNVYRVLKKKTFVNPKTKILGGFSMLNYSQHATKQEVVRTIKRNANFRLRPLPPDYRIHVDRHAFDRWNQRISFNMDWKSLKILLKQLQMLARIQLHPSGWGTIDGDIAFGYKQEGHTLIIQTFLGRISIHPVLANYGDILRYKNIHGDQLDLRTPKSVLKRQKLPIIPKEVLYIKGSSHRYYITEYCYQNHDQSQGILYSLLTDSQKTLQIIDLNEPYKMPIRRSILYLLLQKGYQDFVLEHVAFFKPQKLALAIQRYQEQISS